MTLENGPDEAELAALDPRALIAEAYRLDGPSAEDCRSIFLDWALGRTEVEGDPAALRRLHAGYAARHPDHPMTAVLAEGLTTPRAGRRSKTRREV